MRKIMLAFVALVAFVPGLAAQNPAVDNRTATATITIPTLLHIDVSELAITFASPTFDDFDATEILASSAPSVIDTRGNVAHDVTIQASAATMTSTGAGTKPAGDLQWSADAGTSWNALTTSAVDVVTALTTGSHSGAATVDYKMLLDETTDLPGTYTLQFVYTVVAN